MVLVQKDLFDDFLGHALGRGQSQAQLTRARERSRQILRASPANGANARRSMPAAELTAIIEERFHLRCHNAVAAADLDEQPAIQSAGTRQPPGFVRGGKRGVGHEIVA